MAIKVPIALGGTGAGTAALARANLGIAANVSGLYTDVTIVNANVYQPSNIYLGSGNVLFATVNAKVTLISANIHHPRRTTIGSSNVLVSVGGSNVTFETPGTTVVGAQFKTPGIHDLSTQRIVTLKSNNYSANRKGDYTVPTLNIKAKYNNVAVNTAGRIIYSNRFDDQASMPDTDKYEGFVAYDRNPGGPGELFVSNALQRHKILIANADATPGANNTYALGTPAARWTYVRVANDVIAGGNVRSKGGAALGGDQFTVTQLYCGINTTDPQYDLDVRGNVYVSGNLTVKGNVYVVDTQHLIVDDPVIELGANIVGAPTQDEGILMNRGTSPNVFLGYDESRDEMVTSYTTDPSSVSTINIAEYTTFRANSVVFAVEGGIGGHTDQGDMSKVGIGTASPGRYKVDIHGNANVGILTATSLRVNNTSVPTQVAVADEAITMAIALG